MREITFTHQASWLVESISRDVRVFVSPAYLLRPYEEVPNDEFLLVGVIAHPDGVEEAALDLVEVAEGDAGEEDVVERRGVGLDGGDSS